MLAQGYFTAPGFFTIYPKQSVTPAASFPAIDLLVASLLKKQALRPAWKDDFPPRLL